MIPEYGMAVVRERAIPTRWEDLRILLRQEYGPGTDLGFLQAEVAAARAASRGPRPMGRAATRLLQALLPGRRRSPEEPEETRAVLACDGCAPDRR